MRCGQFVWYGCDTCLGPYLNWRQLPLLTLMRDLAQGRLISVTTPDGRMVVRVAVEGGPAKTTIEEVNRKWALARSVSLLDGGGGGTHKYVRL